MIRSKFRLLAAAGLAFALATGAASAEPIVVKHVQGETTLPAQPKKAFVYDLAALDTLDVLGVPVAGVPGSNIPDYLGKYRDAGYAKIGSLFDPDYEAVAAARPDIIIVGGRSAPKYRDLSKLAPTLDMTVPDKGFLAGARENALTLGRIFGRDTQAAAALAALDASVAAVRAKAAGAGKALIILTNGGKLTAYGPGSRFGWLHDDLGVVPAVPVMKSGVHGDAVSFEFLAETDPDWLFVIDRDSVVGQAGAAAKKTLDNELVARTKAARSGHIVYVDAARWYLAGGGLGAVQASVDEVAAAFGAAKAP